MSTNACVKHRTATAGLLTLVALIAAPVRATIAEHPPKKRGVAHASPTEELAPHESYRELAGAEIIPPSLRNPFLPPAAFTKAGETDDASHPLIHTELTQLRLTAIIRDQAGNLKGSVETAAGRGFIVTQGSKIGPHGGVVKEISPERIVVEEPAQPALGQQARSTELSIRGDREDWQTRHAIRSNSAENP